MNSSKSIETWIEALRGRASSAPAVSEKEIALIRRIYAVRATKQSAFSDDPVNDPVNAQRWNEFLQRMREDTSPSMQKVEQSGAVTNDNNHSRKGAANQRTFAIAAGIGVLAVSLSVTTYFWQMQNPADEAGEIGMRGSEQVVRIQSADPAAQADGIIAIFNKHKLVARRIESAGGVQIQAKVPVLATEARSDLAKLGIEVPEHGRLNIFLKKP